MTRPAGKKIDFYRDLHHDKAAYGTTSAELVDEVSLLIRHLEPRTVLDYGCGKGALISKLAELFPEIDFYGYDPAIPERNTLPIKKADIVINTDVLEHISEDELPRILEDIARISQTVFFNLHHAPAVHVLPNGENAHCTVKPPMWYYRLFQDYFHTITPLRGNRAHTSVVITISLSWSFKAEYRHILMARRGFSQKMRYWKSLILSKILWGNMREKYRVKAIERAVK